MKKAVVAGGSGFVGKAVLEQFKKEGWETVVLSRSVKPVPGADRVVVWDAASGGPWEAEVSGAGAVVNLTGESVMTRFTLEAKRKILSSRVDSTRAIAAAIASASVTPSAWVNASAIGFYGDGQDRELCEASPRGSGFLAETCEAWEKAFFAPDLPGVRRAAIRVGIVLGRGGGAFEQLSRVTKMFAGGALGTGRQYMSWIHLDDIARMFVWASQNPVSGVFNGTAPAPVTNAEMMSAFRGVYGRPPIPPAPAFMVRLMAGAMNLEPDVILEGARVLPRMPLAHGFEFLHPSLGKALDGLADAGHAVESAQAR